MRHAAVKVLALGATCLMTAACTGGAPSSGGGGGEDGGATTLQYLIEEPEDAEALQALEDRLDEFTEASGVEVDLTTLPFDTMRTVLQTQLRSGEGPDVFNWGSGPGFGGALAEAGLLYDLTEAYEQNDWQVYDFAKERVTVDGNVYGVPGEMETIGLFYNADAFAELGIEPPQSLDELRQASETIKQAGLTPMAASDKEGWQGGHYLSMALSSDIGAEGMEDLFAGDRSWDSPEVVSAFQLWKDLNEAGYLVESPVSVDYDTATSQFFAGDAVMIPTGSWLVGEIEDATDFEVGYIPFPAPDGPGIFSSGLGSGPFVSASTDAPEAAVQLVDFLASPEHGRWIVENLNSIPPQPIDTEGLDTSPLFSRVLEDVAGLAEGGDFGYNIDVMTTDVVNEAIYDGFQGVLTGQTTPEDAAAQLQAASQQ